MKKLAFTFLALLFGVSAACAQSTMNSILTQYSKSVAISTATTTKLITGIAAQYIYVTLANVIAAGTGNIQFVYGTGTNCGTGQVALSGNYTLVANTGFVLGTGVAPVFMVPSGNDVCAITSAAVGMNGVISYAQF